MTFLITGATGLIGRAVADALLARGDEVVGLSRDPARARSTNPTVAWHAWDPANERPPAQAFAEVDAVVNLIGENINQLTNDPALVLCAILEQGGNPGSACDAVKNLLDTLPSQELNRGAPFAYKQIGPVEVEKIDKSLGGLVEVNR